jgi:hypothetical protein
MLPCVCMCFYASMCVYVFLCFQVVEQLTTSRDSYAARVVTLEGVAKRVQARSEALAAVEMISAKIPFIELKEKEVIVAQREVDYKEKEKELKVPRSSAYVQAGLPPPAPAPSPCCAEHIVMQATVRA